MNDTLAQIDAAVTALWPLVVAQQDAYLAVHGCYYQMLWTHSETPSEPTPPDALDERPTDQPATTIRGLPSAMRARLRIDTYGQPVGWTMTLQARIDGEVWQRAIDCGVDATRSMEWTLMPQPQEA